MIKIKNVAGRGEIYIHGVIVDDTDANWLRENEDGVIGYVFPAEIREQLDALRGLPIDLHIASDGGNVAAGVALYNMLAAHDAPVTVYIDAWAASIASYLAFVGQKIVMPENTFLMIHNPTGGAVGEASYLRSVADYLDKIRDMLAARYAESAPNWTEDEIKSWMDEETWFTAAEAAKKFGDKVEVVASNDMKAVAQFSGLKSAPAALKAPEGIVVPPEAQNGVVGENNGVIDKIINTLKGAYNYEDKG